jgi:hypothetical protein
MSLVVSIINKQTESEINSTVPTVLIDEFTVSIKEKLLALVDGIAWYPAITKLLVGDTVIKTHNALMYFYPQPLPQNPQLYVVNLLDELPSLYDMSFLTQVLDTEGFSKMHADLSADYIDLTEDDLEFAIKLTLLQYNSEVYKTYTEDVQTYIKGIVRRKEEFYKNYIAIQQEFQPYYETLDSTEFEDDLNFTYSSVAINVMGNNFESKPNGRFIRLDKVFNMISLNETIPFVAYKLEGNDTPTVKVYDGLTEYVADKDFKSWIINEKKRWNVISYKKIKGLVLKVLTKLNSTTTVFATVILNANGTMLIKVGSTNEEGSEEDAGIDMETIMSSVRNIVNVVSNTINSLAGVFLQNKRLDNAEMSSLTIDAVTASTSTDSRLDKNGLRSVFTNEIFREHLFEVKDTVSQETLSLFYKKYGRRDLTDAEGDNERKGLTVNVKDNPFRMDSSIITIFGANYLNELIAIVQQLNVLSIMSKDRTRGAFEADDEAQTLKQKSHIKHLRKSFGVHIDSKKCQRRKQPEINSETPSHEGSYTLEYKGLKYVCPNPDTPYPGFINDNSVCCFEKDQRRRDIYVRNTQSSDFDIIVQPSNYIVDISESSGKGTFSTYVIKVVSEYVEGFDESNSMSRYYYISENNELVPIRNDKLIEQIKADEEIGNIWLGETPLAKLISGPPKNKCNSPPDMSKSNSSDINAPCAHHKKNKIFGYSANSYPCCFDSKRKVFSENKRKENDITKQYILTSDKILDYQRLGSLPPGLEMLFNDILGSKGQKYYRMGVLQNKSSFLNAVLLAMGNIVGEKRLNNALEFRRYLSDIFDELPDMFPTLNSGNLSSKYTTVAAYKKMLTNTTETAYWKDVMDLVQQICNVNIMVFDIPYKSKDLTKVPDYENIKIVCTPEIRRIEGKPYLLLLKRQKAFELVVQLKESQITTVFTKSNKVVSDTLAYYDSSCVKESAYPQEFTYDVLPDAVEVLSSLVGTEHEILGQVVNPFNKVDYLLTKSNALVPIKEAGINPQMQSAEEVLLPLGDYITVAKSVSKFLKTPVKPLAVAVDANIVVQAVFTNFGQFVPVQPTLYNPNVGLQILDYRYYAGVDKYIKEGEGAKINDQTAYSNAVSSLKASLHKTKTKLAKGLSSNEEWRNRITQINEDPTLTRFKKLEKLVDLFKMVLGDDTKDKITLFVYRVIANEVIMDNRDSLLASGIVASDVFDPSEIISREGETVLSSIDDIIKWLKRQNRQ